MAQHDFQTIDPAVYSGTDLASDLNSWVLAVISNHSGATRPSYLPAGGSWYDTANSALKFYNGTSDETILKGSITAFGVSIVESADAAALRTLIDVFQKSKTVDQDSDTGAANIPVGTTAQAPTAGNGKTRFDTDTNEGRMGQGSNYHNIINDRQGVAGGTVDAITVAFSRPVLAWVDNLAFEVEAAGANTSTTPTINPNGIGAKTIVKNGNQALAPGDIAGAGHRLLLRYDAGNDKVELLNPVATSSGPSVYTSPQQAIVSAGQVVLAHGLGSEPDIVQFAAKCITAEYNYSIGDVIGVSMDSNDFSRASGYKKDATNITIRYSSSNPVFNAVDANTGATVNITNANWEIITTAVKF